MDRIYRTAQQDGADFNLAYIGSDFIYPHNENFDTEYMKRLFDYAYRLSANGYRGTRRRQAKLRWSLSEPTGLLTPHCTLRHGTLISGTHPSKRRVIQPPRDAAQRCTARASHVCATGGHPPPERESLCSSVGSGCRDSEHCWTVTHLHDVSVGLDDLIGVARAKQRERPAAAGSQCPTRGVPVIGDLCRGLHSCAAASFPACCCRLDDFSHGVSLLPSANWGD